MSLNIFNHDLSLGSEYSKMVKKMVCVFDFTKETELILYYIVAEQSII